MGLAQRLRTRPPTFRRSVAKENKDGVETGRPRVLALVCAVLTAALVVVLGAPSQHPERAAADTTTHSGTTLRDNWDSAEPSLTPSAITPASFGRLYSTPVGGQIYARPLVWHGTVLVATETNQVAAIESASGALEWSHHFGTPWNVSDIPGCTDITPTSGITATPVIDPATGTAYFVTKSYIAGDSGPTQIEMHAVDMTTGHEQPGWPVVFRGTASNDPTRRPAATFTTVRRRDQQVAGDHVALDEKGRDTPPVVRPALSGLLALSVESASPDCARAQEQGAEADEPRQEPGRTGGGQGRGSRVPG